MEKDLSTLAREKFHRHFPNPHSLFIALHAKNLQDALTRAEVAYDNGADGVALVTHVMEPRHGVDALEAIKNKFPHKQAIINILQFKPLQVFHSIHDRGIDGIRTDNALIQWVDRVREKDYDHADNFQQAQDLFDKELLYIWPFNFKHQRQIPEEEMWKAIIQAKRYLDVITTSGKWTGYSADASKVAFIKQLAGEHPVGLASGLTPENFETYQDHHDLSIVATWVSDLDDNLIPARIRKLADEIERYNSLKAQ